MMKIVLTEYEFILFEGIFLIKFEKVSFDCKRSDIGEMYFIEYRFILI